MSMLIDTIQLLTAMDQEIKGLGERAEKQAKELESAAARERQNKHDIKSLTAQLNEVSEQLSKARNDEPGSVAIIEDMVGRGE